MSLLVVAYPDIEQRNYDWIESIRVKQDQAHYDIVRPHFTLVFPVDDIAENEFIDHVERCARTAPIPFVLRSASTVYDQFEDRWLMLLIPDEGNGRLSRLHDSLYTGILADKRLMKVPYIPHVTVASSKDCQTCKDLAAEANRVELQIAGRITAIEILRFVEERIETIRRIDLRGHV